MENGWYRTTRFQNSPVFLKIRDSVTRGPSPGSPTLQAILKRYKCSRKWNNGSRSFIKVNYDLPKPKENNSKLNQKKLFLFMDSPNKAHRKHFFKQGLKPLETAGLYRVECSAKL